MENLSENHDYINQLINDNNISQNVVEIFQDEISDYERNHFRCNPKTSLKNCKQLIPGYEPILVYENGLFYQKLVPCAHLAKQLEKDKILDRFYFVNFDPLQTNNFLFFSDTARRVKMQTEFYQLDVKQDFDQISKFITDKNEFKKKQDLVQNFLNQMNGKVPNDKGVYLVGTMGVGKTNLLKFLALVAAQNYEKTVAFTTVNHLVNKLKEGFSDETANTNRFLMGLANVDLLILDDMGAEQVTRWVRDDVLFTVLNQRMENHKLTYFTSNLTLVELEKHYLQINEKDVNKKIKTNRLMERIKTLATEFALQGQDHRY